MDGGLWYPAARQTGEVLLLIGGGVALEGLNVPEARGRALGCVIPLRGGGGCGADAGLCSEGVSEDGCGGGGESRGGRGWRGCCCGPVSSCVVASPG